MKKPIPFTLLAVLCCNYMYAQINSHHVVNATGGSFQNGNNSYEWSIGESALVNEMQASSPGLIITNGFLQSYANGAIKDPAIPPFADKEIRILPNPTKDNIRLQLAMMQGGRLKLLLFDEAGNAVYKNERNISQTETLHTVNMHHLSEGTYLLQVELKSPHGAIQYKKRTYKIIKIH